MVLAVLLAGCGDAYDSNSGSDETAASTTETPSESSQPPTSGEVSFAASIQPIFDQSCARIGCHAGGAPTAGQNLSAGQAYASIVNVPSKVGSCTSFDRVEPGVPETSALFLRISGEACGTRMPRGGTPLSSEKIETIRSWIQAGAPNN